MRRGIVARNAGDNSPHQVKWESWEMEGRTSPVVGPEGANGVGTPKGLDNKARGKRSATPGTTRPDRLSTPKGLHTSCKRWLMQPLRGRSKWGHLFPGWRRAY